MFIKLCKIGGAIALVLGSLGWVAFFARGASLPGSDIRIYPDITTVGFVSGVSALLPFSLSSSANGFYSCTTSPSLDISASDWVVGGSGISNFSNANNFDYDGWWSCGTGGGWIVLGANGGSGSWYYWAFKRNAVNNWNTSYFSTTTTNIITTTPADKSTKATSTSFTIGATGYVTASDFSSGNTRVKISYGNNGLSSFSAVDLGFSDFQMSSQKGSVEFILPTSGYFDVSTTTSITAIGRYTMTTSITAPYLWIFSKTLTSTSTSFTVATSTTFDNLQTGARTEVQELINASTQSDACQIDWTSLFSLPKCLVQMGLNLFIPTSQTWDKFYALIDLVEQKPPVGYFTVVVASISGVSASSTPAFSLTIPAHLKQYIFDPFDIGIGAILWFYFLIHFYRRLKHITI
jgi:hypothetical protein